MRHELTAPKKHTTDTEHKTEVFAITGASPEVLAYAMAKYSRSSLSLKEAIAEISSQKASEFLNTFYFAYGHKSIGDMAHIPLAIENISLLAAIEVVDEPRWDGQERSTRYQDFSKRIYYTPSGLTPTEKSHYDATIHMLFDAYDEVFHEAVKAFALDNPRPEGLDEAAYQRTIRARAFDVARYLLPMATMTSVGQITSARTLEGQISRMRSSRYTELHELATQIQTAVVTDLPHDVTLEKRQEFVNNLGPEVSAAAGGDMLKHYVETHPLLDSSAPTLLKYADENLHLTKSREVARRILKQLDLGMHYLVNDVQSEHANEYHVEVDMLATCLYEVSHYSYRRIRAALLKRPTVFIQASLTEILNTRGPHDEHLRTFRSAPLTFDIIMDIGGMRDLHRHRRAIQVSQDYAPIGFALPDPCCTPKIEEIYNEATRKVRLAFEIMKGLMEMRGVENGSESYLLPLGTKHRFLMKMDIAEALYISELRTGPAGHISYRRVAWEIYRAVCGIAPTLAAASADRVTDPSTPLDFFKR